MATVGTGSTFFAINQETFAEGCGIRQLSRAYIATHCALSFRSGYRASSFKRWASYSVVPGVLFGHARRQRDRQLASLCTACTACCLHSLPCARLTSDDLPDQMSITTLTSYDIINR